MADQQQEEIQPIASHASEEHDRGSVEEIQSIASHDSEEDDRGSNMAYIQLMASPLVLQNEVKLLHEYHQLLMSAVGIIIFSQAMIPLRSEGITGFKNTLLIGYADFSVLMFVMGLELLLLYYRRKFGGLGTCYRTAAVVLQQYALLLLINKRYIRIAIVPVIILVFIGGLANKFKKNLQNHGNSEEVPFGNGTKSAQERMKMAMIPYCLQLSLVIWTQLSGEQGGTFVLSHFPLFINSSIGALAVMIAAPPIGASPGVVQVLPALHKSCLIMLLIATFTMAAEWLGEGIILVCMPEFIAVLVWFTNRFDHAGRAVSFNVTVAWGILGGLILDQLGVLLIAYDRKIFVSWYRSALCISSSSSALSFLHVWMLHQWPRRTSNSNGPIKLLKFSAVICLFTTAMLGAWSVNVGIKSRGQVLMAEIVRLYLGLISFLVYHGLNEINWPHEINRSHEINIGLR